MPRVPVLLYHSLTAGATPSYRRFAVDPDAFREQMAAIVEAGVETTTIADLVRRTFQVARPTVAITFDDGFAELIDVALPVLEEHRLAATVFVVSGHVGGTSAWLQREREHTRPLLDWDGIRALAAAGVEIGGHGHRHLALDLLPDDEAADEIRRSREEIENGLGSTVESFAYPYGFHTMTTKRLVADAGFGGACGVRHAFSGPAQDALAIARIVVEPDLPMDRFRAWVLGLGGLRNDWSGERVQTRLWRAARRLRAWASA